MGWDDLIRDTLATAKTILGDGLLATVQHAPYTGQNAYAEPTYGAPTGRLAVVSDSDARITRETSGGQVEIIIAKYRVQFLEHVAVDTRDRLTLPDGRSAPILQVDGGVLDDAGVGLLTGVLCG